ncbi:DUF3307 domain-containing protein [Sphingobacterium psychroaquaticum]|uniref:Uncharacterized protein n=1 Tax=Sphingobacterium psychroaquaticum TaxID=561061 RepID=A0A1X7JSC2_9SPHI|nr:DUF3307 domain-containing protein [Sphingobacterium psychroaquaticum]QBQ41033.1 DUF3307 domain-containing protein [Sphingobacterium psychroaquaticum]SMG30962.1 Protein of unknown function [Sphingobacterium psychroaquaticum]
MIVFFLKLFLAHIMGDFLFQPRGWVEKRKYNVGYLLLHIAVHTVLLAILFIKELSVHWQALLFVICSHLVIDSFKIWMERTLNLKPLSAFLIDQFLHMLVLAGLTIFVFGFPSDWIPQLLSVKTMLYVIAFLLTTCVSPILLNVFFSRWKQEKEMQTKEVNSLVDAGMLIGIMERLLIVFFIQISFLSGVGFLLAAKSIFRFGDLANAKDTKFTEYVLLGTLASFMLAIVIGYGLLLSLKHLT